MQEDPKKPIERGELRRLYKHWRQRIPELEEMQAMSALLFGGLVSAMSLAIMLISPGFFPEWWESNLAAWVQTGVFLWAFGYYTFYLSFRDHEKQATEITRINEELTRLQTPDIVISCGNEGDRSITRDWVVQYKKPEVNPHVVFGIETDFFGFALRSTGAQSVKNLGATLTRIERVGSSENWDRPIALPFEPHSIARQEPIESIDLRDDVWQTCTVCSVRGDELNRHTVMAGSINMTSRYGAMFERFFEKPGRFICHVSIHAENIKTIHEKFLFVWGGTRSLSDISRPTNA